MTSAHLANHQKATAVALERELPVSIEARLRSFAQRIASTDRSLRDGKPLSEDEAEAISEHFQHLVLDFENHTRALHSVDPGIGLELGREFQARILPYLLLTENGERWYSKPLGYAGDYLTIHQVYENCPRGRGRIGPLLDRCVLNIPGARAVRNRRQLLVDEILRHHAQSGNREPFMAMSLACGPAAEVFDILEKIDPATIHFHLIDIDPAAVQFVNEKATTRGVHPSLTLHRANAFHLMRRRRRNIPPINFAYSMGLVDYFDDRHVTRLLDLAYEMLAPGGLMLLGNFHPRNPNRALLDSVFEWPLIHRSQEDMHRLCRASRFASHFDRIIFEDEEINMFAIIRKPTGQDVAATSLSSPSLNSSNPAVISP